AFIQQGYSLFTIAESRKATIGTIAKHIEQLIQSGYHIECKHLVSKELMNDMQKLYKRMPYGLLKHFRAELGDGYEYAELRIALALIKHGEKK
ncbi:MAG: helix-turn-helix domain-containing protein, partial [Candidatus Kapaibacteriota bacterium]